MQLREETVEIRGAVYTVRELSAREMIPLMDQVREEGEGDSPSSFGHRIFEASASLDGEPLSIDRLPGSVYLRLMPVAMRLNGMSGGND
jgi:hypothetical protein